MASGYYEYSPMLFDPPGFTWNGPDIEELKKDIWPAFIERVPLEVTPKPKELAG